MADPITNIITVRGDMQQIRKMQNVVKNDVLGIGSVDFNKIIPMPSSLDIDDGSQTIRGMKWYKKFLIDYKAQQKQQKTVLHDIPDEAEKVFLSKHPEIDEETWLLGKVAHRNIQQHGYPTWYGWRMWHWGAYCNATACDETTIQGKEVGLLFQTLNSAPHRVIDKLAESYPELEFEHLWVDVGIGQICGRNLYRSGELYDSYIPSTQKESVEFATKMMGVKPEEWDLYLNEDGDTYTYADFLDEGLSMK